MACVAPFITLLEYDVFNPREVKPEFTADVGTKQGEKCDYAIFKENEIIMLIECKKYGENLSDDHTSQLYRYFSVVHAPIAVLTNGVLYRFYTDLEESNKMDAKPFLEFDLSDIQPTLAKELKRFTKSNFDVKEINTAAKELKYTKEIKQIMKEQLEAPTPDFVRFFLAAIYSGTRTQTVVAEFTGIVKRAWQHLLNEQINERSQPVIEKEKTENQQGKTDQEKQGKPKISPLTRLCVTMPDGKVIDSHHAKDTFVDVIAELGLEEASRVVPNAVSKEPFFPHNPKKAASTVQRGEFYINTHNSTERKKRILEQLASNLNVQLKIEIIDKSMV